MRPVRRLLASLPMLIISAHRPLRGVQMTIYALWPCHILSMTQSSSDSYKLTTMRRSSDTGLLQTINDAQATRPRRACIVCRCLDSNIHECIPLVRQGSSKGHFSDARPPPCFFLHGVCIYGRVRWEQDAPESAHERADAAARGTYWCWPGASGSTLDCTFLLIRTHFVGY